MSKCVALVDKADFIEMVKGSFNKKVVECSGGDCQCLDEVNIDDYEVVISNGKESVQLKAAIKDREDAEAEELDRFSELGLKVKDGSAKLEDLLEYVIIRDGL